MTPDTIRSLLGKAMAYVERARLNLSFAKQDAVSTAAEAESNRNSAYHDCVQAIAALERLLADAPAAPGDDKIVEAMWDAYSAVRDKDLHASCRPAMAAALAAARPMILRQAAPKMTVEMPASFTATICERVADSVQYRIDRAIERDGSLEAARVGAGMGFGFSLMTQIVHALKNAAKDLRLVPSPAPGQSDANPTNPASVGGKIPDGIVETPALEAARTEGREWCALMADVRGWKGRADERTSDYEQGARYGRPSFGTFPIRHRRPPIHSNQRGDVMIETITLFPIGLAAFMVGIIVGAKLERSNWREDIIKKNLALYDPVTGKWRWQEPTDTPAGREGRE